ncbi:MAG: protein kinase [Bryobacteraceae bacterium]
METDLWLRVERITGEALALPAPQRLPFVRSQCAGDQTTLDAVVSLLDAEKRMDAAYLENTAVDFVRESYGQYRALREIGRGGMSVVYLGERTGDEFSRQVAIKILLAPGALTQSETRILASLEHPNIARLFDAGATASGFRFLVMEYVDGVRIDHYCRTLGQRQRLRLFLDVCAGVRHANRALVVHRDLKPANILVTAEGVVKLLDFGIAKLLSLDASADHTAGVRAWTPDYASPEQILGEPATASTDVYSLGVLLCELIGGQKPRAFADLPLAEVVDRAANQEVGKLPLQGDLELIARKALRRDPAMRYESAGAMADDIERYLDGRPVLARPHSWTYSARKFLWRRRYPVSAAAIALAALIATAAVAVWQARIASQRFNQVRGLAGTVLFEIYPEIEGLPGSLPARQKLAKRSLEYLDALAADPRADASLLIELSRGYRQLADIQGTSGMTSLGDSGAALARSERAASLARRALEQQPSAEARKALSSALTRVATTYSLRGAAEKGFGAAREAVSLSEANLAADPANAIFAEEAAETLHTLAAAYSQSKDHVRDSLPLFKRVIEIRERMLAAKPTDETLQRGLARSHQYLARTLFELGEKSEAEVQARMSYRLNKARLDAGHDRAMLQLATDLGYLAVLANSRGDLQENVNLLEEQLRLRAKLAQLEPANAHMKMSVGASMSRLGYTYARLGRITEAIRIGERALATQREVYARDRANLNAVRELYYALIDLAETLRIAGRKGQLCSLVNEAMIPHRELNKRSAPMSARELQRLEDLRRACSDQSPNRTQPPR